MNLFLRLFVVATLLCGFWSEANAQDPRREADKRAAVGAIDRAMDVTLTTTQRVQALNRAVYFFPTLNMREHADSIARLGILATNEGEHDTLRAVALRSWFSLNTNRASHSTLDIMRDTQNGGRELRMMGAELLVTTAFPRAGEPANRSFEVIQWRRDVAEVMRDLRENEPEPAVRQYIITQLVRAYDDAEAVTYCLKAVADGATELDDEHPIVIRFAIFTLAAKPDLVPFARGGLTHQEPGIRALTVLALQKDVGSYEQFSHMVETDADIDVRIAAAKALTLVHPVFPQWMLGIVEKDQNDLFRAVAVTLIAFSIRASDWQAQPEHRAMIPEITDRLAKIGAATEHARLQKEVDYAVDTLRKLQAENEGFRQGDPREDREEEPQQEPREDEEPPGEDF